MPLWQFLLWNLTWLPIPIVLLLIPKWKREKAWFFSDD